MGKIANRQSLAFSERGQLSQAIPQFHVERILNEFSKQGSTPTPWARGLRDQIQKWALQTEKTLYF